MNANPPKIDVSGTVFSKVFGRAEYVEDLPGEETAPEIAKIRSQCLEIGNVFTSMVHVLRSDPGLPEKVRQLAALLWDLVGNRITPVAFGPEVDSIHFWAEVPSEKGKNSVGCIMIPHHWLTLVNKDPFMQFGAIVYTASHARDYYNKRLTDDQDVIHKRSLAFEADYLHSLVIHPQINKK